MNEFSPPSSPGKAPIQIRNCVEELLKFTLESSINETLDFDLTFSNNYCSTLLKHDDVDYDRNSDTPDTLQGVPPYPLYKHLASALYQAIISKGFVKTSTNMMLVREENSMQQREDEWNQLVVDMGTELVNAIREYDSFSEMLEAEGLAKVLPGVKTIEEGVQIYRKFYSEDKEKRNGVLAICVGKPAAQPFTALTNILLELGYEGIQRLLGLVHTVGTVSDTLPPPKSALLSSFLLPFKQNVQSSILTDGARALAKHVKRSSDKYWGSFDGNDSDKNRYAVDAVNHLIAHCCWLNIHIVPPHGAVFEIRVAEGYGARWSKDGTKFIGFVEPYMEDGHSKGWQH